ncbi:MAG: IPTL-CTERM sorting domain-containing protein [Gallionellaceae bacterium]
MSKSGFSVILMFLSALFCLPAYAATVGFNGYYDYSTWTKSSTFGDPVVSSVDGPQQTLTIMEPNSGNGLGAQEYDLSHVVESSGTVSFDWSFDSTVDDCCSGLNFYVNGVLHNLIGGNFVNPGNFSTTTGSGHFSIAVNAGDTITFGAFSEDGCCGASTNIISNFSAPTGATVPTSIPTLSEWGMVILSSLLAFGAVFALRRQRQ